MKILSTLSLGTGVAIAATALLAATSGTASAVPAPIPSGSVVQIDVLPYTINSPGTYCLANSFLVFGPAGIVVEANGVTIDLGGHELQGDGTGYGIRGTSSKFLNVRNGTVRGWDVGVQGGAQGNFSDLGISECSYLGLHAGNSAVVERVHVTGASDRCVETGPFSTVRDVVVDCLPGAGFGMLVNQGCTVEHVSITGANGGIFLNRGCSMRDSIVRKSAIVGVQCETGCLFESVVVEQSEDDGFVLVGNSVLRNCIARDCASAGARVLGKGSVVEGNTLTSNALGLSVPSGHNKVTGNVALENATDYAIGPLNQVGPILKDFMTITSTNPYANFATPLL
ncbi:MAG: hypothetical protein R3F34_15820 [Planctomycetota bacterium]